MGYHEQIEHDGYAIVDRVLEPQAADQLAAAIDAVTNSDAVRRKAGVYGIRNLLSVSDAVRDLAATDTLRRLVTPVLGNACFAVRATFFDKVPDANWKLRWHQDGVIAVRERIDTLGFQAWSEKAGVMQVRPPTEVLAEMLAIRVHLDDCTQTNGPLRVLAGSHRQGWMRDQLDDAKERFEEVTCEVAKGGVLAMRPLLLHASSASESPAHRRVIH
ncbi:MAG: phytanoyl-CoA dioxygenase family protein, partial [Planctomycetota bacterium]